MMGNRSGRLCFIYQIDFSEHTLTYDVKSQTGRLIGEVNSDEEFYDAVDKLLDNHKSDRIEIALKFFKLKGSRLVGICPKSFPRTELTSSLLSVIYMCMGTEGQLLHLPFEGSILEQPNLFIEAHAIYLDEYNKFMNEERKQQDGKTSRQ